MPPKARADSQGRPKAKATAAGSKAKAKAGGQKAKAAEAAAAKETVAPTPTEDRVVQDAVEVSPAVAVDAAAREPDCKTSAISPRMQQDEPLEVLAGGDACEIVHEDEKGPEAVTAVKHVQLSVADRCRLLQEGTKDPWCTLSIADALERVNQEQWELIELESLGGSNAASHVMCRDAGRSELPDSEALRQNAVSLDFTENVLARVDVLPSLWLRQLLLSSNPLESMKDLGTLFPRLLCLDLSYVELPPDAWESLAACADLRVLVCESCGLESFQEMLDMPSLQSLEVSENEVEELQELREIAVHCPGLRRLDLRENPVASEPGYAQAVKKHLPKLEWHDNQSRKQYVALGRDKIDYSGLDKDINAVDGLYKNESCSCLEGNPCIDPVTCVDWEHREAVAAEARRRKGLRGPAGERV